MLYGLAYVNLTMIRSRVVLKKKKRVDGRAGVVIVTVARRPRKLAAKRNFDSIPAGNESFDFSDLDELDLGDFDELEDLDQVDEFPSSSLNLNEASAEFDDLEAELGL